MSVYSQTLRSEVFDPRVHNENRSEFRLDKGRMFFSNLRLGNIGVTQTGQDDRYSKAVGAAGHIRRVTLYDGAVELDKCEECNRYLSWYLCGGANDSNRYVGQNLLKHNIGYAMNDNKVVDGVAAGSGRGQEASGVGHLLPQSTHPPHFVERMGGYLDLRMALPFLDKIGVLDTDNMFHNLRVVLEYEPDNVNGRAKVVQLNTNSAIQKNTPILIADELKDEGMKSKAKSQLKSFVWNVYEKDLVSVPAVGRITPLALGGTGAAFDVTPTETQKTVRRVDGYKNKIVNRLVMMKCPTDKATNLILNNAAGNVVRGVGDYSSLAMNKEKINFVVNGRQLISGEGLNSPAKIADIHADAWSNYNILPFSHQQNVGLDPPGNQPPHNVFGVVHDQERPEPNAQDPRVGQSSWVGVRIGERVNTLDLEYERVAVAESRANFNYTGLGLDVHFYAEVPKQFILDGSGYRIEYL